MGEILCLSHFWKEERKSSHKGDFSRKFRLLIALPFQPAGSAQELSLLSHTPCLSPLSCICTYTYINISGLLQIPLSNSNNCYWSVNGQEILSLSRDRRWTRYPVKVHSSLISITQRFTSCENASLLAQENQSKSWSFADVTMEENSVQKGDKPLHLFLMAS